MRTDEFDYTLPPECIAQIPRPRGDSRLLVLDRHSGAVSHRHFSDILSYIGSGDVLALNDTRVTARRVRAWLDESKVGEAMLLRPQGERAWEALVRPGRKFRIGSVVELEAAHGDRVRATVVSATPEGGRILEFSAAEARDAMAGAGVTPLPPYIRAGLEDEERYQTVYAAAGGSAAAPTAGLHFTEELLNAAQEKGVKLARITLHVGIDTFRPVRVDSIEDHEMHGENFSISNQDADTINRRTGRLIAVGTTTVRALESAANEAGAVSPAAGATRLFIRPGFQFRAVQGILTNFHLPKSTLLMMISAFAGRERIMAAYEEAVRQGYWFYSFGDAMLIL